MGAVCMVAQDTTRRTVRRGGHPAARIRGMLHRLVLGWAEIGAARGGWRLKPRLEAALAATMSACADSWERVLSRRIVISRGLTLAARACYTEAHEGD
jgi:hypothetical protein